MKSITYLLGMIAVGSAAAALRGGTSNVNANEVATNAAAAPSEPHRHLQERPDQTCYHDGNAVPCSEIGSCNNAYACADSVTDAVNLGELFCPSNFMYWNNEEPYCPWLYMCCN